MKELKVRLTFTEGILGTMPSNEEIYTDFILSRSPDAMTREEEIAAIGREEATEKGTTVFPKTDEGIPFLYDYQILGFFKDTCGGLKRVATTESAKIKAYKKEIDKLIFVKDRQNPFFGEYTIGICERPLRAQTMQGERVSLARSEEIPAGAQVEFTVVMLLDSRVVGLRQIQRYRSMAKQRKGPFCLGGNLTR